MLLLGVVTAGCDMQSLQGRKTTQYTEGTESNIIQVSKFISDTPWLSFESDGSNKVGGIRVTVYLEGAGKPKGVFGSGTIVVGLYRVDRDAAGQELNTLMQEWELPPEKAFPWRAKKETFLGWGYSLRLQWDKKLDLAGKLIAVQVKYVRNDGSVVNSRSQMLRVPGGETAPAPRATAKSQPTPRVKSVGRVVPKAVN